MSCWLCCGLRVFWWVKNCRGHWVEVSHAPVNVKFTDCADLQAKIDTFSPPDRWSLVVDTKQDLGLWIILHQYNRNIDFHTEVSHFIGQL
jgi:hypothetical protein